MADRIDWGFIEKREEMRLDAYVIPGRPNAGVTIAMGIDLGHWSESDLRRAGLRPETLDLLRPFLGRKGVAAAQLLAGYEKANENKKLTIDRQEADRLNALGRIEIVGPLRRNYDTDLRTGPNRFEDLPEPAQTVLASVAWQYGPNLAARTPRFWDHMTRRNWEAAVRELRNFGDADGRRRRIEADHLEKAIR